MTLLRDVTEASNRVSLGLKCGECIHLSGTPAFERPCAQLGKTSFADACPSFTPDLIKITLVKRGQLEAFAELVREYSQPQLRLLAYLLRNTDLVKKSGFQFGEAVVFSLGGDYLECYVRGYIIGADVRASQVYISSDFEGLNKASCLLTLLRPSVLSMDAFKAKRKELIAEGRVSEPKHPKDSRKRTTLQCLRMSADERAVYRDQLATKPDDYVPPSIDTVPASWLDSRFLDVAIKDGKPGGKTKVGKVSKDGKNFTVQGKASKPAARGRAKPVAKAGKARKK